MSNKDIVINDLLSFFINKLNVASKTKLINCINEFYSKSEIIEAKNVLFTSLPTEILPTLEKDDANQRNLLISIYDCLKICREYLPTFVCRNLNNIPQIGYKDKQGYLVLKDLNTNEKSSESYIDIEDSNWIEDICRKEQRQMKHKISKMLVIITEIKNEMQKFIKSAEIPDKREIYEDANELSNEDDYIFTMNEETIIKDKHFHLHNSRTCPTVDEKVEIDFETFNSGLNIERSIHEITERNIVLEENLNGELQIHDIKDISTVDLKFELDVTKPVAIVSAGHAGQTIISINDGHISTSQYAGDDVESVEQENCITHILEDMDASHIVDSKFLNENGKRPLEVNHDLRACSPEKCPVCKVILTSKLDYDIHARTHYSKGSYVCALCHQDFTARDSLIDHFLQCVKEDHINMKDHSCSVCGSFYADQVSLVKHKSLHSECRRFPCSYCSFRYFTKKGLQLHIRNQHNPRNKYFCPLCNLSFFCNGYLLTHIAIHTGARPFSCNLCDQKTDTKKAMKHHLHSHGSSTAKNYKCKECKYYCDTSYGLLKHRLSEHREAIQCTFCDKSFRNPSSYKRHYDLHKSESNFKCKLCSYSTTFRRYLDKHMLTHPSTSLFTCPKCYVSLSSKHTVGLHLKNFCFKGNSHSAKRNYEGDSVQQNNYKCSSCLYATSCKQNLEKHMITHPTVTSFFCPKCCIPLSSKHTVGHHLRSYCIKNDDNIIINEF